MKKFGLVLIIVGALITSYPIISQLYDSYLQNKMLEEMDFLTDETADSFGALGDAFDSLNDSQGDGASGEDGVVIEGYEEFDDGDIPVATGSQTQTPTQATTSNGSQNTSIAPKPTVKLKALGSIEIPKVKIKMPLVEGTGEKELVRSAGHMTGTDMPGEIGNSVIAGHRGYSEGRLFNRLDELVKGDTIKVKTKKGTFVYEVYETKIVKPNDLSVLNRNDEDKVLTLITCTPMFKSTHRIIIHAIMR